MKVLVVGATGKTGRHVTEQLSTDGTGKTVRALVRDRAKADFADTVEVVVGDVLKPETLQAAMTGCDAIICATGAAPSFDFTGPYQVDFVGTKNLVDVAKAEGIQRFVIVSSLCVSKFFHPLNLFWLVLFWKQQAEQYIVKSGLTYTIVRPGGLRSEDAGEAIVMSAADTLFDGGIARQKVAQVCIAALGEPTAENKIVEIVTRPEASEQSFENLFAGVAG
ncbi:nad-dependent epimerase dehydratase [Leptolyngbya sp. Heron Island J]|uniref:SDR family oxidoreductase n=1 Tax=Leptolyngbya sp. Heron Island J TaxID=1385935 RepID=UPI0003B9494B|nr:SDR family oxidoreductase [Leptolyngbya sp. Heron Island J]ESA38866.1 nad-dependent epimerase dehydratase [Leptolyngbya sp. Heron Island J]